MVLFKICYKNIKIFFVLKKRGRDEIFLIFKVVMGIFCKYINIVLYDYKLIFYKFKKWIFKGGMSDNLFIIEDYINVNFFY